MTDNNFSHVTWFLILKKKKKKKKDLIRNVSWTYFSDRSLSQLVSNAVRLSVTLTNVQPHFYLNLTNTVSAEGAESR